MTTDQQPGPTALPTAHACPSCRAALPPAPPACPACGLRLLGPDAARLWEVDLALVEAETTRRGLLAEREHLLARLRGTTTTGVYDVASKAPAPRAEWTPARVQNSLLGLGVLLLAVAGLVFAAVTYERLGLAGRAAVLLALTAGAVAGAAALQRRGLRSSAEAVSAVALVLGALDLWSARRAGLASGADPSTWAACATALLAGLALLLGRRLDLRLPVVAAVLVAQLPVPLLLDRSGWGAGAVACVLLLLGAADVAAARVAATPARTPLVLSAVLWLLAGTGAALDAAYGGVEVDTGTTALVLLAGLLVAGAVEARLRTPLLAGAVVVLAVAAHALSAVGLTPEQQPLVGAAVGLLALPVAALAQRSCRPGLVAGSVAVCAVALLAQGRALVELATPLLWADAPWTLPAGTSARAALAPGLAWSGTVVTMVSALALAAALGLGAVLLDRPRAALPPLAALAPVVAALVPLGLATSWPVALAVLLVAAAGLAVAGRRHDALLAAAAVTATGAVAWSIAGTTATLVALPLVAAGALAVRRPGGVAVAGLLVLGETAAAGAAAGLAADQVGALLLAPAAALAALAALLPRAGRELEGAAVAGAGAALVLTAGDVGWLAWALALTGLVGLASALRPDRRRVAVAGGLLLSASSWVRLADAGVQAPEPYVVPLGLAALVLGHLRRRAEPTTGSLPAYGPGLVLLLVPSLVASLGSDDLTRPLLLGLVALLVLLAGVRERLQAPLATGGAVLAVDALHLLTPYAAALPRWLPLATAGLLLVAVGATYEQRRADLAKARRRFDALA